MRLKYQTIQQRYSHVISYIRTYIATLYYDVLVQTHIAIVNKPWTIYQI